MKASDLISRYFPGSETGLRVQGLDIRDLAEEYGTPLFVYDSSVLRRKYEILRSTLPATISIYYSVKANPNQDVLRFFLMRGCGLEIASSGELFQARLAGCPPEKILFAGPGKTDTELGLALAQGIGEIHVESEGEFGRIARLCRDLNVIASIALRINPAAEAQGGAMRMGGKSAPFGVDEERLDSVLDLILSEPAVQLRGIHLFAATQILDHAVVLTHYRKALELAERVAVRAGRPLATVDFGGGLGIPYFAHEADLDMGKLCPEVHALMAEAERNAWFKETRFVVELGRYLAGEAGVYVARVIDVKVSRGRKYVILDGGMNHHLAASGNLGQAIKRNYPVAVVNRLAETVTEQVEVVGPLCTPLDVLAREVQLPACSPGDLVGIFQSGAYARAASPLAFLSHNSPPEVFVDAGLARSSRARGSGADFVRDQQSTAR